MDGYIDRAYSRLLIFLNVLLARSSQSGLGERPIPSQKHARVLLHIPDQIKESTAYRGRLHSPELTWKLI